MKPGDIVKSIQVAKGPVKVAFEKVFPVAAEIRGVKAEHLSFYVDHLPSWKNQDGICYANRVEFDAQEDGKAEFTLGHGYLAEKDEDWSKRFMRHQGWSGGDGIYSFNLVDGNDRFDQKQNSTNLFVFGDTFIGRTDKETRRRYGPLLMMNNSLGIVEPGKNAIDFRFNQNERGSVSAFVKIDPKLDVKGTIPQNLCSYDQKNPDDGWVSGYHPKKVWVTFDLKTPQPVDRIVIENYLSRESPSLSSRGVRIFRLLASLDGKKWDDLGEYELPKRTLPEESKTIQIGQSYRFFQFDVHAEPGIGNYDDDYHEGLFALSRVYFYKDDTFYRDVEADASSVLLEAPAQSYVWLQDGAIIGKNLYLFPYQVISDHTQPEGMQFGIMGIQMVRVPIENERPQFQKAVMKRSPFWFSHGGSDFTFGGAVTANTVQAGAERPDGYVYVFGYKTTWVLRQAICARVKAEDFELFDKYEYWDGITWQRDILRCAPLIDHVSTEFSVSQVLKGRNKGKWLAVYTYDTNTIYVCASLGETIVGPFEPPQVVYRKPEPDLYKQTTYCYNAKAHPQLSESQNVLVSYNVNTYNFEHNLSDCDVYVPRFIRLREI